MKLLAIPAAFAAAAQAASLAFLNDIPVDGNYTIGTDFVLEWKAYDATPSDTFQLSVSATNNTPSGYIPPYWPWQPGQYTYDSLEIVLDDAEKYVDGSYTWTIKPIDEKGLWKGQGFSYSFAARVPNSSDFPRSFHIVD
ncbi:hypothetical protein F4802DRAFT_239733 [Xylaria palmicola]|nr:hypothetical protein F4802DRAFT_239733 [Xylaria palmicola]